MARQALIVQIDERLAREVRQLLGDSGKGYASLSEFVEVALINQLGVEVSGEGASAASHAGGPNEANRLLSAPKQRPETLAADPDPSTEGLFVLTNRFGPMKVAARVLANMGAGETRPDLDEFQVAAAAAARALGVRLREADEAEGRSGSQRRWVAFPIGADERAARDRFAFSFTLEGGNGSVAGPMATLGLANLHRGCAALTELGWRLAVAPSPLLGEVNGLRFSPEESAIMREAVRRAPRELELVEEFLSLVREAEGRQTAIDALLARRHSEWTSDLVTAHRSAMLGRLADLNVLEVSGRGPSATITLLEAAREFSDAAATEETSEERNR
jgi:hypothetical protein